ncbi:MAG TPA: Fe-S cluster assembly protein SufD [Rhodospirillaceae bacterium]|nr:Fe-S cluster assembly protein SufD [Rhodospirillaceae bacterium]
MRLAPDNLPAPKQEEWKYTNISKAIPQNLTRADDKEIVIHKNRGQSGGQVEEILFTGRDGMLQAPVLKVVLDEGAELTLIERHTGAGSYWKNTAVEITLGTNARLHHYRIIEDTGVITINTVLSQKQDSFYNGFTLIKGGALVRNETHAALTGKNAECDISGVNLLKGKQHADTTIVITHEAPHCRSSQFFRSVLGDESRGVFQGKIHVRQAAQKTDGYQLSNALLLSDRAEMDTKPELEIYADDVKCSHGATCGQLDDEPLFYLRSRGLTEVEARMLLVQAFVDEAVEKVADEKTQVFVKETASLWLKGVL